MRLTKIEPLWAPEGESASAPAAPEGAATPTDAEVVSSSSASSDTDFVLDAFDAMQIDDLDQPSIEPTEIQAPSSAPATAVPSPPQPDTAPTAPAQTTVAQVEPGVATPPGASAPAAPTAQQAATPDSEALAPEMALQRIHDEVAKHQEIFTQRLAETVYKLPEKELESFNEDPAGVIAKVAARVHTNVVASLTRVLSQQMPVYVHGLLQANARAQNNENEFWAANPTLNRAQHSQIVTQVAVMYKQLNPNATRSEFIKTVGAMAAGALGLTAQAVQQRAANALPAPVRTPGPVVRNVPPAYQPAGAHSAPPGAHPAPQLNEWERMTVQLEQENQGAFDT